MSGPIAGDDNLGTVFRLKRVFGDTPEARELAAMLGLADDNGYVRADDKANYTLGFAAPKVGKAAKEENPAALNARPRVSTAPEALRNLPPVVIAPKPKRARSKPKPTGRKQAARRPARKVGSKGRKLAPCGTYGAYRRHLRYHEPVDEACRVAAREQWRNRDGRERYLAPHGTYTAKRRHKRLGEPPCDLCAPAQSRPPSTSGHSNVPKPCGTEGAYRRHLKYGTPVCVACRTAHNERNRQLEAEKRNAA